ncbi:hypothetical protein [Bacteriovorax sp. DB6_IX]|uniref:hypothetical protein n=1 Tax=Bacteriovorax sp. DB6_IX TaxID=1353530 RepID=UPI00038A3495|nr:hypothetical protein [Bacteriovorax sp. DB6_IX]EQC44445.1 hypothetical protein M901_0306 [Bacteriovorax sp. DB6_IX]
MKVAISLVAVLFLSTSHAGIKEKFVERVVKECGKSEADAKKLATPGRSGNVVKLKLCPQSPVTVAPGCKLTCSTSKGNVVGN